MCLETLGYWSVAQYQVDCPKLAVRVDKDLSLQDLVQTLLVYKTEVRHSSVWVCKTINKDKKTLLAKCESKEILDISKS